MSSMRADDCKANRDFDKATPDVSRMSQGPLLLSFLYAGQGVISSFSGRNFKIQLVFACAAVILCLALDVSVTEWLLVLICIGLVLALECVNTAVEAVVDLACSEFHPKAKLAKDAAAGAPLIASTISLFVGLVIFLPKMIALV